MNRVEFMRKLAELLVDLPAEERAEALQFYNGYFYDAGPENEQKIIQELQSPEAVSEIIHREVLGADWTGHQTRQEEQSRQEERQGGYRAPDYRAYRQQRRDSQTGGYSYQSSENAYRDGDYAYSGEVPTKRKNPWKVIAIIALCVIFFPVIVGLLGGALGLLVGAIGLVFGLIVGAVALTVGLLISGIAGLVGAALKLAYSPIGALLAGGASLMAVGFGLIACWLLVLLVTKLLPWLWRGVKRVWNWIFHRRREGGMV